MKIKALENIVLECITGLGDDGDSPEKVTEVLAKGDIIEVDICDNKTPPEASEIQFGDGSVSFVTPEFWASVEILQPSK